MIDDINIPTIGRMRKMSNTELVEFIIKNFKNINKYTTEVKRTQKKLRYEISSYKKQILKLTRRVLLFERQRRNILKHLGANTSDFTLNHLKRSIHCWSKNKVNQLYYTVVSKKYLDKLKEGMKKK